MNGIDEVLDLGDDCHEVNLLSRAKLMGIGAWNLGNVAVELVEHHKWERSHLWTRFLSSSRCCAFHSSLALKPASPIKQTETIDTVTQSIVIFLVRRILSHRVAA